MVLNQWDATLDEDSMTAFTEGLSHLLADRIYDQGLKAALLDLIHQKDYLGLCEFELQYSDLSVSDTAAAAQILALYQKRADIELGVDKAKVAYEKFIASECRCRDTNELFKKWSFGAIQFRPEVERVLHTAQQKIASILGDVPTVSQLRPHFGPGATTQVQKRMASARRKLSEPLACSEEFVKYLETYLPELPAWIPFTRDSDTVTVSVEIHTGKLSFVPKNAKTDRSIVVEPMLNSFFQLGVGDYIANRLRARGVDIRDQSKNQKLARLGSLLGELATLDLSSASDTIARELVAHLLPIDWFLLLDSLRTGVVEHEGVTMRLQKFSSMGNGFTFPLETLIFWALSESCIDGPKGEVCSVYGDDIIVPVSSVPLLRVVLDACGFLLNPSKSFSSGPFRESCGKDYHSGILVRPAFVKDRLSGETAFILHNFFVRNYDSELAAYVLSWLGPDVRLFGPDGYGDGHLLSRDFIGTPYGALDETKRRSQWCGSTFDTFTWKSRKSFKAHIGDYVYTSYSIYLKETQPRPLDEQAVALLARLGKKRFRQCFGDETFRVLLEGLSVLSADKNLNDWKKERFGVTLPGANGYKRISIYTLK